MKIRLAAYLQPDSIVDGEGIRTVIWTQGCPHHCFGCQNPETWDFDGGAEVEIDEVKRIIDGLKGQDGITFSGGDPMMQPAACAEIAKYARSKGLNIWCYTGYDYETLLKLAKAKKEYMDFLKQIDVLVDGKFILEQKTFNAIFRGSSNQRIIDVPASLKNNRVELVKKYLTKKPYSNRERVTGVYI